jgi:hydrogenase-4 component F
MSINALVFLLPCPILILVSAVSVRRAPILPVAGAALMWTQMVIVLVVCGPHLDPHHAPAPVMHGFRLDVTAALFVVLTTLVVSAALTHAVGFFRREIESEHPPTARDLRVFYAFTALFLLAMNAVVAADNLGFLWIAVEATTLVSAPLVCYHRSRTALEATWK